jgi:hypothetical protein
MREGFSDDETDEQQTEQGVLVIKTPPSTAIIAATGHIFRKLSVLYLRGINAVDLHESKDILAY